jgi:hypothetical protein
MRRRRFMVLAAAALVGSLVVLAAAACGGGGPTSYVNKDYKFQLTYDSGLLGESTSVSTSSEAGGKSVFDIGFVDPKGTKTGGVYRDGLIVSVYKLTQTVTDSMLPLVKTELEGILPQLQQSLGSGTALGPLAQIDINGIKGFSSDATFTMDTVPFKATLYFLINGDLEYQVTAQAAESRWSTLGPVFKTMMESFKATQ